MLNIRSLLVGLLLGVALLVLTNGPVRTQTPEPEVKIGMLDTLFDEKEEKKILAQIEPFANLVRKKTQTKGTFGVTRGLDQMIDDLKTEKIQMGVLHGLDYAWLKPRLADAKPLLIAVNDAPTLKAVMVVPKKSDAKDLAALKDKQLSLGPYPPYHVRIWLNGVGGGDYTKFFKVKEEKDTLDAIEEVADEASPATAVTEAALRFYQKDKPVRYERFLKVLAESPEFPAPVMIYRPGKVKADVLERFRNAMLSAHESEEGKDTLNLWKLKRFTDVPANYEQMAQQIAKHYPAPK